MLFARKWVPLTLNSCHFHAAYHRLKISTLYLLSAKSRYLTRPLEARRRNACGQGHCRSSPSFSTECITAAAFLKRRGFSDTAIIYKPRPDSTYDPGTARGAVGRESFFNRKCVGSNHTYRITAYLNLRPSWRISGTQSFRQKPFRRVRENFILLGLSVSTRL